MAEVPSRSNTVSAKDRSMPPQPGIEPHLPFQRRHLSVRSCIDRHVHSSIMTLPPSIASRARRISILDPGTWASSGWNGFHWSGDREGSTAAALSGLMTGPAEAIFGPSRQRTCSMDRHLT